MLPLNVEEQEAISNRTQISKDVNVPSVGGYNKIEMAKKKK